jgi:hypothetical protein
MKTVQLAFLTAVALVAIGTLGTAAKTTTWTGLASDGKWTTTNNWDNDVPTRNVGDVVVFDSGSATNASITLPTGSTTRPVYLYLRFTAGAASYTVGQAGSYIDNGGNGDLVTFAGMTNNQTISQIRIAQPTFTLDGSGCVTITNGLWNNNGWTPSQVNTLTFNVNHTDAVLTVGGIDIQKRTNVRKYGPGKLVLNKTIDWSYGFDQNTNLVRSLYDINAGSVDVSDATLHLEQYSGAEFATGQVYTVVDYSGATLVRGAGFRAATGVPDGWEVAHDPDNSKIVLRESRHPRGGVIFVVH